MFCDEPPLLGRPLRAFVAEFSTFPQPLLLDLAPGLVHKTKVYPGHRTARTGVPMRSCTSMRRREQLTPRESPLRDVRASTSRSRTSTSPPAADHPHGSTQAQEELRSGPSSRTTCRGATARTRTPIPRRAHAEDRISASKISVSDVRLDDLTDRSSPVRSGAVVAGSPV